VRGAWWAALTGLVFGAAVAAALLFFRGGLPATPDAVQETGRDTAAALAAAGDTAAAAGPDVDDVLRASRENAIVRATRMVAPAVVSIDVVQQQAVNPYVDLMERMGLLPPHQEEQVRSMGSGVIVSSDGLIVTNQHVVQGAVQLLVTLSDGRRFQAVVVDEVPRYDLAVLQVEGTDLPVASLASGDDLEIGEWAIAIGSPFGYLLADTQPTVTVGVISAVNRDIARQDPRARAYLGMVQTDAAINPGNSGGPLVDTMGRVIGINTFIFSESGGSVGIGFAVPAARVRTVLDEIARYGHYRDISLGLVMHELNPRVVERFGLKDPVGVIVSAVVEDGAAWTAGLRRLDILREIGGVRVLSLATIERVIYNTNVGDHLSFVAEREGELWRGDILIEERK